MILNDTELGNFVNYEVLAFLVLCLWTLEVLVTTRYWYGPLSSAQEEAEVEDDEAVIMHHKRSGSSPLAWTVAHKKHCEL